MPSMCFVFVFVCVCVLSLLPGRNGVREWGTTSRTSCFGVDSCQMVEVKGELPGTRSVSVNRLA